MNRAAAICTGLLLTLVAGLGAAFVVYAIRDNQTSTPNTAVTTTTTLPPGLTEIGAGCSLVTDTLHRADVDADAFNRTHDQTQLAHPLGRQDVWNPGHQSDLDRAVDALTQAAALDAKWQPIESIVKDAAATMSASRVSRVEQADVLYRAEAACVGR